MTGVRRDFSGAFEGFLPKDLNVLIFDLALSLEKQISFFPTSIP
jgi:hypothetical protein